MAQNNERTAYMRERAAAMLLEAAPELVEFVYWFLFKRIG